MVNQYFQLMLTRMQKGSNVFQVIIKKYIYTRLNFEVYMIQLINKNNTITSTDTPAGSRLWPFTVEAKN